MSANFDKSDADKIGAVLVAESVSFETDHYRIKLVNEEDRRSLVLQVYPEVTLGKSRGMLVVVYTGNSHLQLHNCTGYVVSDELGEVTFVSEKPEQLSGLVVERGASCSLYGGMSRELISSDFTQLGVEAMLSGVAMSLVEDILSTDEDSEAK
ncbi:MAG: hypothetical protein KAW61_07620 [candidate division Zixibacteria bacterium]|jgi:hypothetical protein|nr:hypothetical protein [candidate division Zixibacteria bacterium]